MLGVTVEAPGVKVEAAEPDDEADMEPLIDGDIVGLDDKLVNVVKFDV